MTAIPDTVEASSASRDLMSSTDDATVPVRVGSPRGDTLKTSVADMTLSLRKPSQYIASRYILPKCTLPPAQEFHPVETFVANALGTTEQQPSDPKAYRTIIDCLRRREDPPMLYKLLLALRTTVLHQLTSSCQKQHAHLIHLLFRLDPFLPPSSLVKKGEDTASKQLLQPIHDGTLAQAHLHLLLAMVSANSVFLTPGMNALWRLIIHSDDAPEMRTSLSHAALCNMLRLCPKGNTDLLPILACNFPFRTKPTAELTWYAKQCLAVLDYVPTLHAQVLELLMDKCLEMDVEIKINDGGRVSIEREDDPEQQEGEGVFELELNDERMDEGEQVDEMADKLDSLMNVLLHHIRDYAHSNRDGATTLYRMISPVFDSIVLTTHRSKFVQFVVFVLCGLQSHLDREFAAKLIDVVLDPYRATVTRQSAACYLASFMSRASYVSAETVCEAVCALLRWAEAYIVALTECGGGSRASSSSLGARDQCDMHSLFYTVCQASFYVMCFRGAEAMKYYRSATEYHSTRHNGDGDEVDDPPPFVIAENVDIAPARWTRICGHELQPLRFCLESVRGEFLHVAGVFQLLPPELLHKLSVDDSRLSTGAPKLKKPALISTAVTLSKRRLKGGVGGMGQGSNPLDSFFPFDPYLLRQSHCFVEVYYKNWEGSIEEEEEDEDLEDAEESSQDEESDEEGSDGDDDDDDGNHHEHMPQSVDSSAFLPGTSYASNMSHSTQSTFQPGTPQRIPQQQFPREAWSETLKRTRAQSIDNENGSW